MSEELNVRLEQLIEKKDNDSAELKKQQGSVKHLESLFKELSKFVKEVEKIETIYSSKYYDLVNTQDALQEFLERIEEQVSENMNDDDRAEVESKVSSVNANIESIEDLVELYSPVNGEREIALDVAQAKLDEIKNEFDGWRKADVFISAQQKNALKIRDDIRDARDRDSWSLTFYHFVEFKKAMKSIGYKDYLTSDIDQIPKPQQIAKVLEEIWDALKPARDEVQKKKYAIEKNADDLSHAEEKLDEAKKNRVKDILKLIE